MKLYKFAFFYRTYRKKSIKILRLIFFIVCLIFLILALLVNLNYKLPLFFISIFLMTEAYYKFFITRILPPKQISQKNVNDNELDFLTLNALSYYHFDSSINDLIRELCNIPSCEFLLERANIKKSEIEIINITKNEILNKAFLISKEVFGKYVTTADLLTAYLISLNDKNSLFIKKHLKESDILNILYWTRFNFPEEEKPKNNRIQFLGEGIFDNVTFGWTPFTSNFILDLTAKVLFEKPVVVGRRNEFREVIDILSKSNRNNALLIGEIGSGKTTLVEAFAYNSFLGNLTSFLNHKRVYQLMIGPLLAGTRDIADLEERLEIVLEEIAHSGNIIIYIPDLENLLGSSTYHTDLSDSLVPYLKNSHLPIIATATNTAFKTYIQNKSNFLNFFEIVKLEEPKINEVIQMVLEKTERIEIKNNVIFTFKAIVSSVSLSKRFFPDKVLPGSAISLLESVASTARLSNKKIIDEDDIESKLETQTHISISTPRETERNLLLHLEDYLGARIIGQQKAINAISQALRRLRVGMVNNNRPISFLFLGPTGVGKTETAKVLGDIYFKNQRNMIRLDMSEYKNSDAINRLLGSAPGQGNEKGELTEKVLDNPFSLILLDEFEKANPQVLDLFLQILEDGRLTDNKGRTVSFVNTIIIATSNAGAIFINQELKKDIPIDDRFKKSLIEKIEQDGIFKIELLNRFDDIIIFSPLTLSDIYKIAEIMLNDFKQNLKQKDIDLNFNSSVIDYLAKKGFNPEFGARPLRRLIEGELEDIIAKSMLEGKIEHGSKINLTVDNNNLHILN